MHNFEVVFFYPNKNFVKSESLKTDRVLHRDYIFCFFSLTESLYDYDDFVLTEVTRLLALLEQWYKARDQIQTSFVYHFDEKTNTKNVNNVNKSCIKTELTHNHNTFRKIRWADEEGYELTLVKEFGHLY